MQKLSEIWAANALADGGIYLGRGNKGFIFAPKECGVLVLGPPRSGKTTSVVVPNVLIAPSSVVVTSTKRDVIDQTYRIRNKIGPCYIFNPANESSLHNEVETIGWSPLDYSAEFDKALLTARSMVTSARPDANKGESQHWTQRATELLATLLHAASVADISFRDFIGWVNRHEGDSAIKILASKESASEMALDVLTGIINTDFREQSGIWSTASSVCSCYQSSGVIASSELPRLDYTSFLKEKSTVYVVASGETQQLLAPVIAGFISDIKRAAYVNHAKEETMAGNSSANSNRLLLVLDELANIAPLYDLPEIISEGASQGVLTLACLQDLSQARRRWPTVADGFFTLFQTKFILPGLGDRQTLENISLICGEKDEIVYSKTSHGKKFNDKKDSHTASVRKVRRLPIDEISRGNKGKALVLMGSNVGEVNLTPGYTLQDKKAAEIYTADKSDNKSSEKNRYANAIFDKGKKIAYQHRNDLPKSRDIISKYAGRYHDGLKGEKTNKLSPKAKDNLFGAAKKDISYSDISKDSRSL